MNTFNEKIYIFKLIIKIINKNTKLAKKFLYETKIFKKIIFIRI